ncbi:LysR family transcriptional regulator [Polyangium jinanense]|uniref:LysR family transcriptional regulator n=1 Tax=Polyangium jinanense TaxID=2829994 RepID=A0A9X4AX89_9BACT|nr:LysR family transcriptional regulator [Polyangium jinanense]MDC3958933.1 LysR family transcriptional regulator [Polyangium jinanense]MDC3986047.1 LysR family transcriptional regulator [Polyangium jinanense]
MQSLSDIAPFVKVVEACSFTLAAKQLGLTPSGVSRVVSRLEARLGVRLLHRTTRNVTLTESGAAFYQRCVKILADVEDAERAMATARKTPRGRLRADAPTVLGEMILGPRLPSFLAKYPEVSLELTLRDHFIDPLAEGIDVVLRMADVPESGLVARRLGNCRIVAAASPEYLERHGRPETPADLHRHSCLSYVVSGRPIEWRFRSSRGPLTVGVTGRIHASSGRVLVDAALAGLGIVYLFDPYVRREIANGALEPILIEQSLDPVPIYALYPQGGLVPPKVRVFIDYLVELFTGKERARRGARA